MSKTNTDNNNKAGKISALEMAQLRHRVVYDRVVRLVEGGALYWPAAQRNALLHCLDVSEEAIERIVARINVGMA